MAHDYKRNAAYKPKTRIPGWLTFFAGLAIGLSAAFLLYLKQQSDNEQRMNTATVSTATTSANTKDTTAPPPRFDFYTILPEQEVIIPDQEIKESKPTKSKRDTNKQTSPTSTPTPAVIASLPSATGKKGNYIVQVGAFKKAEEADRLRAALALLGVESTVQVVRIGDSDSFHRVRVGPFDDLERANRTRAKLKQNNYSSILLQVKS